MIGSLGVSMLSIDISFLIFDQSVNTPCKTHVRFINLFSFSFYCPAGDNRFIDFFLNIRTHLRTLSELINCQGIQPCQNCFAPF